ncbi:hypothetical protein HOY80DRAFT_964208 [Tuber brumale]|nr:hypothetical protein HOY80DRAFT_964208 [Tuber brumale]
MSELRAMGSVLLAWCLLICFFGRCFGARFRKCVYWELLVHWMIISSLGFFGYDLLALSNSGIPELKP